MSGKFEIVLVLDSVRSALNVGSLIRTANGMGVKTVITTGVTPHLEQPEDPRLPHVIERAEKQLKKTSLGAEQGVEIVHKANLEQTIGNLKSDGFLVIGLEQSEKATILSQYTPESKKIALVLGQEVSGLSKQILELCDDIVEIEMSGTKDSLNVATAGAIALFKLREILSTS